MLTAVPRQQLVLRNPAMFSLFKGTILMEKGHTYTLLLKLLTAFRDL